MSLFVYNTLNAKKEKFIPINNEKVTMYVCGVTPYGKAHLGHARCYVTFDVIRRYLAYKGYNVLYIQNITDVDDKIINQSIKEKRSWQEISETYSNDYFDVMDKLGIKRADKYPKATDCIGKMQEVIKTLIDKNFAYVAEGSVYFSVRKFNNYGSLSHRSFEGMQTGVRIDIEESKKDPMDFALWKKAKEGEPFWDSPWGPGRPGWHIECSAMSLEYLGETIDIHGGGADLIFPHHENEIAQSECYTNKEFVRYWIHNGFVTINKEKMSKSIGNVFNLHDIFEKYDPLVVRLFLLSQHYRKPIDFSDDKLEEAKKNWERIRLVQEKLDPWRLCHATTNPPNNNLEEDEEIKKFISEFEQAMDDDFNTARALAVIHNFISLINPRIDTKEYTHWAALAYKKMEELLDCILGLKVPTVTFVKDTGQLVQEREEARKNKNWQESDRIRNELEKMGFIVEDTPHGTLLRSKT